MKGCLVLLSGAADRPHDGLRGETPLARVRTPHIDALLAAGRLGRLRTVPPGCDPGPQTALASLLGCAPDALPPAGPLEALGLGRDLRADQCAFVADFVTVLDDTLADPVAGRPREAEAAVLRDLVHAALGGEGDLVAGSRTYRNLLLLSATDAGHTERTPPHAATGDPVRRHAPGGAGAGRLVEVERRASASLAEHDVNAIRVDLHENPVTGLWIWGGGTVPNLEPASEKVGARIVLVSGPGWPRGLGLAAGLEVEDSGPGDEQAAARALAALDGGADLVIVFAEGPWEASMDGDPGRKVGAIEHVDASIVGPLREGLATRGPHRLCVAADGAASSSTRRALADPVPFVIAGDGIPPSRRTTRMTEAAAAAADLEVEEPRDFLAYVLGR